MTDEIIVSDSDSEVKVYDTEEKLYFTISDDNFDISENTTFIEVKELEDGVEIVDGDDNIIIENTPFEEIAPVFTEGINQSTTIVQNISEDDVPYKYEEIDFEGENVIYKGWSNGSSISEPSWRIQRIEFINEEGDTKKRYAENIHDFIHLWADRLTYNYPA